MKGQLLVLLLFLSLISNSQIPLKDSPLFGTDVIMDNKPERNQGNISICSAFNGWLFGVYTYNEGDWQYFTILKSEDNGKTWIDKLDFGPLSSHCVQDHFNITALGSHIFNLKLILTIFSHDTIANYHFATVARFNANTFEFEEEILQDNSLFVNGVAVAINYPDDPTTLAFIYSKESPAKDSLIFVASTNGGLSFDKRRAIALPYPKIYGKVSLSYGRNASLNGGKFFAVWEQKATSSDEYGHLYTTYFDPAQDFQFPTPVCLDSIQPSFINNCNNPTISSQNSTFDNLKSSLTQMIYFNVNGQGLKGFYNMHFNSPLTYKLFDFSSVPYTVNTPDVAYDPSDTTFKLTFFDEMNGKLPLISHNSNDTLFNNWSVESTGYNDISNISSPDPRIRFNDIMNTCMYSWKSDVNNNGVGLFDAPFIYYTNIQKNPLENKIDIYPNPFSDNINILTGTQSLPINYQILNLNSQEISSGTLVQQNQQLNLSSIKNGLYFIKFYTNEKVINKKIIKNE